MKKPLSPADRFRKFSDDYIPAIDTAMRAFFDRKIDGADMPVMREMYGILSEYCTRSGKRIRPLVLLVSCFGYGGGKRRDDYVSVASALEVMHSFLLIQDDIIDRARLRRGGKALHLVCGDRYCGGSHNAGIGSDVALILGDVLLADALEIVNRSGLSPLLKSRFMDAFAGTLEITAWGQILDILHSNSRRADSPPDTASRIAMMKTAHYTIYYPMLMGHILAGKSPGKEQGKIRDFALPLGLAFQVRDDVLGVFGREKDTGKPADSDIMEGKVTLLVSGAMERLAGKERARFNALFTKKRKEKRDVEAIRAMMAASGSLQAAKDRHRELIDQSLSLLPGLSLSVEYRAVMRGLIDLMSVIKI